MAGWTDSSPTSRVFTQALLSPMGRGFLGTIAGSAATTFGSLGADTIKAALFNNTVSPDASAAVGSTGYNTGTWVTANEVTHANWPAGGQTLGSKTSAVVTAGSQTTASAVNFDAADTAGAGTLTLANVYGALVYDDTVTGGTVADQGLCFNYFGGVQSVTGGTFTIVWDATGVFKFTN